MVMEHRCNTVGTDPRRGFQLLNLSLFCFTKEDQLLQQYGPGEVLCVWQ